MGNGNSRFNKLIYAIQFRFKPSRNSRSKEDYFTDQWTTRRYSHCFRSVCISATLKQPFFSQFPDKRQEESITVFESHLQYQRSESNRWVRLRSVTISGYSRQISPAPRAALLSFGMRGTMSLTGVQKIKSKNSIK